MCGGTDLIKQDGVFVCQSCGCKYSVEEARKMMIEGTVEITGTVKVDDSKQKQDRIKALLELAKSAFHDKDKQKFEDYCDKILEMDYKNHEAWQLKAKSEMDMGLMYDTIPKVLNAAKHAVEFAPDDQKREIASQIYASLESKIVNRLESVGQVSKSIEIQFIHRLMLQWQSTLVEMPFLNKSVIERAIQTCQKLCATSARSLWPSDRLIYKAYCSYNNEKSYDKMFSEALAHKIRSAEK